VRGVGRSVHGTTDRPPSPLAALVALSLRGERAVRARSGIERLRNASPVTSRRRICSAPGVPPGSRVASTARPAASRCSFSRAICVLLPAPSPPSKVMKRPRLMRRLSPLVRGASTRPTPGSANRRLPPHEGAAVQRRSPQIHRIRWSAMAEACALVVRTYRAILMSSRKTTRHREAFMTRMILLSWFFMLSMSGALLAAPLPAHCGHSGQRECNVLEHIPSCGPDLMARDGKCHACGAVGEFECPVTVQVPSCDAGLAAKDGRCHGCGGDGEMECPVTVQIPSCDPGLAAERGTCHACGGDGEKECPVSVQIPSCDPGLAAPIQTGICEPCGGNDEWECPATVQVPSCDAGLTALKGHCFECGARGELACAATVQVPSCDSGLAENLETLEFVGGEKGVFAICQDCGGKGEKACPVTVQFPGCDEDLNENLQGRCEEP